MTIAQNFDIIGQFKAGSASGPPWESIVDFATHKSFCGKLLYPRQMTLLKLIYLETEQMTDYDRDVIGGWAEGFKNYNAPVGVQPDIWDRVDHLKANGFTHFPHVQMVMGRRASKGILGGILGAERIAWLYSLGSWQQHFNQVPGQVAEVMVVANSLGQAVTRQFRDIRNTVLNCGYLRPHIVSDKQTEFYIRTPGDEETIAENKLAGISTEREIATIYCKASSSVSTSGRGGTGLMICLDPETPILTADLRWVPLRTVQPGDEVMSVDEEPQPGTTRKLRKATVLSRWTTRKKAYRLIFDDGRSVVCSAEHRWLCQTNGEARIAKWRVTRGDCDLRSIMPGTKIFDLVEPWEDDNSRDAGYLAGVYDGEGSLRDRQKAAAGGNCCGVEVLFTQNPGLVLDETLATLKEKGFDPMPCNSNAYLESVEKKTQQWAIRGVAPAIRFLGQVRPTRLTANAWKILEGVSMRGVGIRTVVSVEELPEQDLIDISTSTQTFIANGLVTHNCYDEMAHMLAGTGSTKTGEEIYDAFQPSLDQFGRSALTYLASSPFSKIGKFYDLYQQGRITMDEYNEREGKLRTSSFVEEAAAQDIDADPDEVSAAVAEPTFLIVQLPSWETYRDWQVSRTIQVRPGRERCFPRWNSPVQFEPREDGSPDERVQYRRMRRNPDKFKVERGAQFASVMDAYLNEVMVDRMFLKPDWRDPLVQQQQGRLSRVYRAHADPSRTNANFGFCIAHVEDAPPDEHGIVWPHVIIDVLKVWKPEDFKDHTIDYVQVGEELDEYLMKFPSMDKMTYDQFNSAGFISHQKRSFPNIRVLEKTFTARENQDRFEKFKSALNLGWVHSYRDSFAEEGHSLLELELKFLQEKNGKVDRQEIGPVQTKDLSDAVMVVTVDLLHESLDRWWKAINRTSVGSTNVDALRSGRDQDRLRYFDNDRQHDPLSRAIAEDADRAERRSMRAERNKSTLANNKAERARRNAVGSRVPYTGDRTRGRR